MFCACVCVCFSPSLCISVFSGNNFSVSFAPRDSSVLLIFFDRQRFPARLIGSHRALSCWQSRFKEETLLFKCININLDPGKCLVQAWMQNDIRALTNDKLWSNSQSIFVVISVWQDGERSLDFICVPDFGCVGVYVLTMVGPRGSNSIERLTKA